MATAGSTPSSERDGVFISVDTEGMAGVVDLHQVIRGTPEYERSCRLMMAETNAAVAGSAQLPDTERAGGRTTRYRTPDFQACYRMLLALLTMAAPAAYQYPRP